MERQAAMLIYGHNNLYPYKYTYYTGRGKNETFHEGVRFYAKALDANYGIAAMLDSENIKYKRLHIEKMSAEQFTAYQNS